MNGLTSSEVLESRKKYGANKIPEKPLKKWNEFFFETFKDGLNLILLGMMVEIRPPFSRIVILIYCLPDTRWG